MNELDIINYAKVVIKDVMTSFLFEPADEVTFAYMKKSIISKMVNDIDTELNFHVEVDLEDGNPRVVMELFNINDEESTRIIARYADCPVLPKTEQISEVKKDETSIAFERAMEIV